MVDFKGEEEVCHEMNGRKGTEDSVSMSSKMGLGRLLEAEKSGKILFFCFDFKVQIMLNRHISLSDSVTSLFLFKRNEYILGKCENKHENKYIKHAHHS